MRLFAVTGLVFLFHLFDSVTSSRPIGVPCADPSKCPFLEGGCVNNTADGKHYCICRLEHMEADGSSWKKNYTACSNDYSPWNISPYENGKKVAFPYMEYERVPASSMRRNVQGPYKAWFGRLGENVGEGGWCGENKKNAIIEVELGGLSLVTMIATQGLGDTTLPFWTTEYKIQVGNDDPLDPTSMKFLFYKENGQTVVFNANKDNEGIVYNFFEPFKAKSIYVQPTLWNKKQCLRIEVYGRKQVDECSYPNGHSWNRCHEKAMCNNTFASYTCTCPTGWTDVTKNGFVCESVDECKDKTINNCHADAKCEDTFSGFKCTCKDGYQGDGYYCEDKDECEDKTDKCVDKIGICTNTIGGYSCSCKAGYEGDGLKECKDIDECKKSHDCHANAKCDNRLGSYDCTCKTGYDGNGKSCKDVDECTRFSYCHKKAYCTNEIGFYICTCTAGYEGSGFWCSDKDECTNGEAVCKPTEKCYNLVGSHVCMCPKHIPRQVKYQNQTEIDILDGLLHNVRDLSVQDWQYSLFYHSHIVQNIYRLVKLTYAYRFKETRDPFYITSVVANAFSVEAYDFRCTEVVHFRFPNLCHKGYDKKEFAQFTDNVDMFLVAAGKKTRVFDLWATTPAPTPPQPGRQTPTLPPVPTVRRLTTKIVNINGTNITFTETPRTTPPVFRNCSEYRDDVNKVVESPSGDSGDFYPPNTRCVWEIEAPPGYDVFVQFIDRFELEFDPKCYYDFVQIFDNSLEGEELGRFCGNRTNSPIVPIRSGHGKLVVVFETDNTEQYFGFTFTFDYLNPRAAIICVSYNIMGSLPKSYKEKWKKQIEQEEKGKYVPITRLLACKQYPKCNVSRPQNMIFTFEHFRYDRNDKKCIHWPLDAAGANYHRNPCKEIKTNLTHTICECHTWGIVTVLGRATASSNRGVYTRYELGRNCFLSVLLVTIGLIFTLFYLFFKDQWAAAMFEVFTKKEYDSGRLIQMHILFQTLLVELFFCIITFDVEAEIGACYFLALLFYYLIQTVFFWLFVYTLFLHSRLKEIFDSAKFNSYKIYLFIGYGIPVVVMLTVTGLEFPKKTEYGVCWLLFTGTSAWGFSGVIVTLGVVTLTLLLHVTYKAKNMDGGATLQHKCLRVMFTTFFMLLTSIFGTLALEERHYHFEWLFSLCNMMQGFSITIMYCILRREDAIIRANQIGPLASKVNEDDDDDLQKFMDEDDDVSFADMTPVGSQDEEEDGDEQESGAGGGKTSERGSTAMASPSRRRERILRVAEEEEEEEEKTEEAAVDEPLEEEEVDSDSSGDHEMEFMEFEPDDYNPFNNTSTSTSKSTIR